MPKITYEELLAQYKEAQSCLMLCVATMAQNDMRILDIAIERAVKNNILSVDEAEEETEDGRIKKTLSFKPVDVEGNDDAPSA